MFDLGAFVGRAATIGLIVPAPVPITALKSAKTHA
jgi:hypothetical protein